MAGRMDTSFSLPISDSEVMMMNRSKKSHRRSQSYDSADSSKDGSCKSGRMRRKMHWSMKDLLVSTTLGRIENESVGSAEHTCATETTVHSPISLSQSNHNSNKPRNDKKDADELEPLLRSTHAYPKNAANNKDKRRKYQTAPHRVARLHIHPLGGRAHGSSGPKPKLLAPPRRPSFGSRQKLIPRISHALIDPLNNSRSLTPISLKSETRESRRPQSPSMPITHELFEQSSSSATTLTPISPTKLSFSDLDSASSADMEYQYGIDIFAVETDYNELSPLSKSTLSQSNEISVVLFPAEDSQSHCAASPLTPSPTMSSPPVRQGERKPRPRVLERILSESNFAGHNINSIKPQKQDSGKTLNTERTAEISETLSAEPLFALSSDDDTLYTCTAATGTPSSKQRSQTTPSEPFKSLLCPDTDTPTPPKSQQPKPALRKSVPVDVDDVRFVDVEGNMEAIGELVDDCLERGDYEEAIVLLKEILRGNVEMNGYEHESVALTFHNIASVQLKRKRFAKALQAGQNAVHLRKRLLGEIHLDTASSLVLVGLAYFEFKKYESAFKSFQEAWCIRRDSPGPSNDKLAKVLNNVACSLKAMGRLDDAMVILNDAVQLQRRLLASIARGDNEVCQTTTVDQLSLSMFSTLSNICSVKISLGRFDEALDSLEEAYDIQSSTLGEDHPQVEETRKAIAFVCEKRSMLDPSKSIESSANNKSNSSTLASSHQTENTSCETRLSSDALEVVRLAL
ncbi:Hydra magnipapillata [Seminavis robusta]|uniref:Hydra magnipapillata n=1 Tax=Seminavis robusta TaxID=568900 RepID=A0A9N8HKQ8_9STRA|nr:Hydra magnipapillata [Seminavis robusta]|eukprot:Sro752_g197210.1 Hydra magnipapillata (743) ;mRNA; r:31147-33553